MLSSALPPQEERIESMGLPSWQSSPATPGGQRQAPVAESQVPPFWQRQARLQFFPKVLAGQAGAREDGEAQPAAPAVHSRCIEHPEQGRGERSRPLPSSVTHSGCRGCRSSPLGSRRRSPLRCTWLRFGSPRRSGCSQGRTCAPGRLQ